MKITEEQAKQAAQTSAEEERSIRELRDQLVSERQNVNRLQNKLEDANRKILQLEIYTRKQNVIVEGLVERERGKILQNLC